MSLSPQIAIAWNGLPFYAACLIKAGIERLGETVTVIGSYPLVPIIGMEDALGQKILWIDAELACTWNSLGLEIPKVFFHTGWSYRGFNSLAKEVKTSGGHVISLIDNSWKNNPRQWIGAIIYRLFYQKRFDAVWVPGNSGHQLCKFLGTPENKIYQGLYGASADIFQSGIQLSLRPKQFLFVGQLIPRKGIDLLVDAFNKFYQEFSDWSLMVIGQGPLESTLKHPGIVTQGFQQPPQIAKIMQRSRYLILPSYEEHWGLVVHEAALSGCGLLLSDQVGSAWDLATQENGSMFKSGSSHELYMAMKRFASLTTEELNLVYKVSIEKSSNFGIDKWSNTFTSILNDLGDIKS
jgi:glycosyltransferase involved in cell wall biosynthesis